ncbi:hypothetical protein NMG60_11032980 [Bertholletia excelsa]
MGDNSLSAHSLPQNTLQLLMIASNSFIPEKALETLIEASRTSEGRSDLASKTVLPTVLNLCQTLSYPSSSHLLLLSLKLLRNLCAGELINQNLFVEHKGVGIVFDVLNSVSTSDSDYEMMHIGLQVLANVSLAGGGHQLAIWNQFFPLEFIEFARIRRREICDPLWMIIYTCCKGSKELIAQLCGDQGLPIMLEILQTASIVDGGEDWLKILLSKLCFEENQFPRLFSGLCSVSTSGNVKDIRFRDDTFISEQAFLLGMISEILNEGLGEISISNDFASYVFGIFKQVAGVIGSVSRVKSGLPTGSVFLDVLGYSLTILRDICARDGGGCRDDNSVDIVSSLLSLGLLELLLSLLQELEPPSVIRKAMKQSENQEGTSHSSKPCPYKGFRRDMVGVIGNCAYRRKHVQDEIRERNGILLLLQQCVTDEDNPFLREWGIWSVRNLLEGNAENQHAVAGLELQGSVDIPEISGLGLKVELDQKTGRAKLVNVS